MVPIKTNPLLKVVSILLIIFSSISLVVALFGLLGSTVLVGIGASIGSAGGTAVGAFGGILIILILLASINAIIDLIAGIKGVKIKPNTLNGCQIFGYIMLGFAILSLIVSLFNSDNINVFSTICGFILPVLYIIGVNKQKQIFAQNPEVINYNQNPPTNL